MEKKQIKTALKQAAEQYTQDKLSLLERELEAIVKSKESESKSSAGDKHETGRARLQREEDQIRIQLFQVQQEKNTLDKIDGNAQDTRARLGSVVRTESATYYLSIPIGKISLDGQIYFGVSLISPIGQLLQGREIGESIEWNQQVFKILDIF